MHNTVEEAIGGYIEAENEIAANSRLRRDDVVGQLDKRESSACGDHPHTDEPRPTTDQAFVEGLARVIQEKLPSLGFKNPLNPFPDDFGNGQWAESISSVCAQAAITYMQQHVRPLVEATVDYVHKNGELCVLLADYIPENLISTKGLDHAFDAGAESVQRLQQALASLPPVLRAKSK